MERAGAFSIDIISFLQKFLLFFYKIRLFSLAFFGKD